jgi:hypothetical protein
MNGCEEIYTSYLHGTKGMGVASKSGDCGLPSSLYKNQTATAGELIWESKVSPDEQDPYQNEWNDLIDAIRDDKPYKRGKTRRGGELGCEHGSHGRQHRSGNYV